MGSEKSKKSILPPPPDFGKRPGTQADGFSDPSDLYANGKKYYIEIEYLHGDAAVKYVAFKAFITEYSDNFTSNWNSEEVYGRPDPIHTFQGTQRSITLGWDVPSVGMAEAQENLAKASKLMRFLYPSYRSEGNASTLTKPPLLRIKFTNLLKRDDITGLLGKVNGFSFAPDLDVGWWDGHKNLVGFDDQSRLYPKLLRFSCEFDVIHEHHLGWHDCTGLWEVVCGKDGTQRYNEEKKSWPYMPSGDGANEMLYIPDPLERATAEQMNDIFDTDTLSAMADEIEQELLDKKSPIAAQGQTQSDSAQAREAVKPDASDSIPQELPMSEREATLAATLGALGGD